jgi:hypothetical protein
MRRLLLTLCLAAAVTVTHADEGMWQPHQMADLADVLKARGLQMDPRELTELTRHPLNAVIGFGFCTASFVSPQGLVVTNHHCALGAIQYNSTPERNLLRDGFLAATPADELPADPTMRVYVTDAIDEVTARVIGELPAELDGRARFDAIDATSKALVAECEAPGGVRCEVYSFHGGLQFFLIRRLEIRDVRLVHAPANAVGEYGGEIDNFEWPRHTGDYAFMRAYVAPDGAPADFHADNVPYAPKSWLKVAADGLSDGDFVMVAGYPGSTNRYRLADEVRDAIDWLYPTRIAAIDETLDIIARETADRPDAAIKYASTVASQENGRKLFRGHLDGFARIDADGIKQQREQALLDWAAGQGARGEEAKATLAALNAELADTAATRDRDLRFSSISGGGLLGTALRLHRQAIENEKADEQRERGYQERDRVRNEGGLRQFERRYDAQVDRALLAARLQRYAALPSTQRVPELDAWLGISATSNTIPDLDARLDAVYAGTRLGETDERLRWFTADRAALEASEDPMLQLAVALQPAVLRQEEESKARSGRMAVLRPRFMQAMIAFREAQGQPVYPDANNSLRLTFGRVLGYSPRDAVNYAPFARLAGILEKHTGDEPFDAPAAQRAAIAEQRGVAPYRLEAIDDVPVNFLSDVDSTGGNSGSPTLNGRGELVGLLFDGNYESLASDWIYNPAVTRSIHVDTRYMRWMMAEVDGARHLLREMGLPEGR